MDSQTRCTVQYIVQYSTELSIPNLLRSLVTVQNSQNILQAGDAVLRRGAGAPQEVREEDEVVLLAGLHEPDLLEECGQAVEDGGGEPGVKGEALHQQVVPLLQTGDGLNDGSDQPDLVVSLAFLRQVVLAALSLG